MISADRGADVKASRNSLTIRENLGCCLHFSFRIASRWSISLEIESISIALNVFWWKERISCHICGDEGRNARDIAGLMQWFHAAVFAVRS